MCELFAAAFGDRLCSEMRPHDLLGFINQFAGENGWTRKRWATTMQRPFNVAVSMGLIPSNPFKGLTFPAGNNGRDWTVGEYQALLRHCKPHLRRFIIMIRFSGMRPGERADSPQGCSVRPECDRAGNSQDLLQKTKRPPKNPLNSVLAKLLAWLFLRNAKQGQTAFSELLGNPWTLGGVDEELRGPSRAGRSFPDVRAHGGRHMSGDTRHRYGTALTSPIFLLRDSGARQYRDDATLLASGDPPRLLEPSDGAGRSSGKKPAKPPQAKRALA